MKLRDKVAVITGGNSGIGLATAREFIANGARVTIFGRNPATLAQAADKLGGHVMAIQGDVRKLADLDRLFVETNKRFGRIDVLVAKGVFFTVQRALPYLRDGASIVLTGASDADKQGRMMTSIYTAAKSAVRALARSLSVELLPRRIRVNVVSPGMTDTPIITREGGMPGKTPEEIAALITKTIPLRRRGRPEEVAKAILFMASDDSSYCLGAELMVEGGLSQLVNPA